MQTEEKGYRIEEILCSEVASLFEALADYFSGNYLHFRFIDGGISQLIALPITP